jgi:hypothetical protein
MQSTIPHLDHQPYHDYPFSLDLLAETFLRISAAMLAPMDLSPANFTPRSGIDAQTPITEDTGQFSSRHSDAFFFLIFFRSRNFDSSTDP